MRQYYYAQDGESHGPVGPAEFRALGLPLSTLIWRETHNDWLPASDIPELATGRATPPPAAAPRKEKREPEPKRHVPHPEPAPMSLPPMGQQPTRNEARQERKRVREGGAPNPTPSKGSGFSLWRLVFLLVIGWYIWSKNRERFTTAPDLSPPPAATAPEAAPEAAEAPAVPETPAALPARSSEWQQEAEEPLKHLVLDYAQPASLAGETTIAGTIRSEAHALTYAHAMIQVAFTNADGALLVKDWRPVDMDLAPGGRQEFSFRLTPPTGTAAVKLEVLRAEVK